ncbi:MAG: Rpn family recombination-promoting nuclease/putative transposase [Kiritimatiellae bacterium]|nr:Rpn family recombination-promoting nuclease/putative transposase [Kiritimatiellia bacterium]
MNERKYVDPKADLTFKKIFGEHPDLITSLLNALLPLPEDGKIVSIEYLTPELVPDDPLHKDTIVDVRCKDQNGRQFIVEMQMIWSPDYNQRALFNAAKAYSRELPIGGDYRNLNTVYSLNLLNDNLALDTKQWYHHYQVAHNEIKGETIDGLQLIFVELKKFKPQTWPERKMAVLWLRFLTEIDGTIRDAPPELKENPDVRKALEMVEASALTPEERAKYDGFQDWLCRERRRANAERRAEKIPELEAKFNAAVADLNAALVARDAATAERDAEKARADAAEAKLRQDKLDTARKLKALSLPVKQIAEATGLSEKQIEEL